MVRRSPDGHAPQSEGILVQNGGTRGKMDYVSAARVSLPAAVVSVVWAIHVGRRTASVGSLSGTR